MTISYALLIFVFVGLATPGPNVIMLLSSGVRFGFRQTLPHVIGVAIGVGAIAALAGFGIAAVLLSIPALATGFKILAALWILFLASRLMRSATAPETETNAKPFTLLQAIIFQCVNPKVWAVALAAQAGYGGGYSLPIEALRLAVTFASLNLFVCLFYAATGNWLRPILLQPRNWQWFLRFMAALMALSAVLIFL